MKLINFLATILFITLVSANHRSRLDRAKATWQKWYKLEAKRAYFQEKVDVFKYKQWNQDIKEDEKRAWSLNLIANQNANKAVKEQKQAEQAAAVAEKNQQIVENEMVKQAKQEETQRAQEENYAAKTQSAEEKAAIVEEKAINKRILMLEKINKSRAKQGKAPCFSLEDHKNGVCDAYLNNGGN